MRSGDWQTPKERQSKTASEPENIDKPEIVVSLRLHDSYVQCLMLCIENIGTGAAHNVRFRTNASPTPLSNLSYISLLKKNNFLRKGINCFGPRQKIEQFLISLMGGLPEELKQPFQIIVTYRDSLNHAYENEYTLDLGDFESLVSIDSGAKNLASDLRLLLDVIQEGFSQVAESIERSRLPQTPKPVDCATLSDEEVESSQTVQSESDKPLPQTESNAVLADTIVQSEPDKPPHPELQRFVALYNAGGETKLRQIYNPPCFIRVGNEAERFQNLNISPIFQTAPNGSFAAYAIDSENSYAVLPFAGSVLQNKLYSSGAFGEVFECPGFDPEHTYYVKVVLPALFKQDPVNDTWTLQEKGKLELKEKDS